MVTLRLGRSRSACNQVAPLKGWESRRTLGLAFLPFLGVMRVIDSPEMRAYTQAAWRKPLDETLATEGLGRKWGSQGSDHA